MSDWTHNKCCDVCPVGEVKAFELYTAANVATKHCGISCVKASDFWIIHKMEPNLKLTKNRDGNPCEVLGYGTYWETY